MTKKKNERFNVIIIGGGIAAHTAALYNARADLSPLVISAPELDQLSLTTVVENYPGFPDGIMGPELIKNCKAQAEKFGAKYILGKVDSFRVKKGYFEIGVGNDKYESLTVIISTGAAARTLNVPGKEKYFGKGVSTCAVCDAALYRNKEAIVIGGGDSAMEESLALSKFATKVTIIHRRNKFRASKIMQERVFALKDKIKIEWNSELVEILGDGKFVTGAKIRDSKTGKEKKIKCNGVFFAIGHDPATKVFSNEIKVDKLGFIKTDKLQHTSIPGVFAAGDCQDSRFKQAITSAGTGCAAALEAEKYIGDVKNGR